MTARGEFELIPAPARFAAAVVFLALVAVCFWFLDLHHMFAFGVGTLVGIAAGAMLALFILLAAYIYADAGRRGMPRVVWTALAVLVPNGVGFVLYFLLRKPMCHPCPHCSSAVAQDFAFCPRCGQAQDR